MTTEHISVTQADAPESDPQPAAVDSPPVSSATPPASQRLESNNESGTATSAEMSATPVSGAAPSLAPPDVTEAPPAHHPSAEDSVPSGGDSAPSGGDPVPVSGEISQDGHTAASEATPSETASQQSAHPAPAAPQRRVQLKPTYSPEIARPIPTLGRSSVSDPAGAVAARSESPSASASPASVARPAPGGPGTETQATAADVSPARDVAQATQQPPASYGTPLEVTEPATETEAVPAAVAVPATETGTAAPVEYVTQDVAAGESPADDVGAALEAQVQAEGLAAPGAAEGPTTPGEASPVPRPEPVALPPRDEPLDADIEAQLDAALSGTAGEAPPEELADVMSEGTTTIPTGELDISKGARLSGTVQSIHGDDMFIDFGVRMAGVLSRRQFGLRRQPMQGEAITVIVNRVDENEGLIHVNLPTGAARVRGGWEEISVDQTVECVVNQVNKGGLEVSVGSLRGFMPASQVELGYVADLTPYVGQRLRAQVTEVNPKRRKLVLSRRKVLELEREQTEQDFFQKVAPGQTYEGRVKTIKSYGAFVDIGGVDGLLHVGQISWGRINHPKDVLTEGQTIEVKVLSVDPEKKKIGLGMRQLSQNPWKSAEERFTAGTVTKGKVTRIENFGAFIELEPGLEGLAHISELDHKRIRTVNEVLQVGQEVDVQVLEVDPSRKRISLSLKALKEKPEEAPPPQEPPPPRRKRPETLKGGIGEPTRGKLFGDPRQFGR